MNPCEELYALLEKEDNPRLLHRDDAYNHILLRMQNSVAEQHRLGNKVKRKPEVACPVTVTPPGIT